MKAFTRQLMRWSVADDSAKKKKRVPHFVSAEAEVTELYLFGGGGLASESAGSVPAGPRS